MRAQPLLELDRPWHPGQRLGCVESPGLKPASGRRDRDGVTRGWQGGPRSSAWAGGNEGLIPGGQAKGEDSTGVSLGVENTLSPPAKTLIHNQPHTQVFWERKHQQGNTDTDILEYDHTHMHTHTHAHTHTHSHIHTHSHTQDLDTSPYIWNHEHTQSRPIKTNIPIHTYPWPETYRLTNRNWLL